MKHAKTEEGETERDRKTGKREDGESIGHASVQGCVRGERERESKGERG